VMACPDHPRKFSVALQIFGACGFGRISVKLMKNGCAETKPILRKSVAMKMMAFDVRKRGLFFSF